MNAFAQLEMRVAGLTRQVQLLREEQQELRNAGLADRMVLVEWAGHNGLTMAEALGPHRNRAVRALRDSLSAERVGKIFDLTGRQVRRICEEQGNADLRHSADSAASKTQKTTNEY